MTLEATTPGATSVLDVVTAIWQRVLAAEVEADQDLFAAGGSWSDAARACALVDDALGVDVSPGELVSAATPAHLAALIEGRRAGAGGRPEDGANWLAPLGVAQEGMLWHEQLVPGSFNLAPLVRRQRGELDHRALGAAFDELVRRHEPLRTSFTVRRGRPMQVLRPPTDAGVPLIDLSGQGLAGAETEARRLIAGDATRPFDLAAEPLFAPRLLRLGPEDHVLVVRAHHTVFDDWSVDIYRRELSTLYAALLTGQRPVLPDLGMGYGQFARRQRRRLAGPAGAADVAWWRQELAGAPFTTQLDISAPPGEGPGGPSRPVLRPLPPALTTRLRAVARHARSTLFMTLLAGFQMLLHRRTGCDDLLIASVVANRNDVALESLIGCFTKKVPLRLRLRGDPTFLDLVAEARQGMLAALAHQDLGFETILGETIGGEAAAHGVVPHVPIMFQGLVEPRTRLSLPGVTPDAFGSTDTQGPGLHVVARRDAPAPWGAGLYPGTFLGVSVVDHGDDVSILAQGGFHRPVVEGLLEEYETLLSGAVSRPLGKVGALVDHGRGAGFHHFRGFPFDGHRLEEAIAACPGVQEARVVRHRQVPGPAETSPTAAGPRLVAHVTAADGGPPSLRRLRTHLWGREPGSMWPAELRVDSGSLVQAPAADPPPDPTEALVAEAWAAALDIPEVAPEANYWQSFSFLGAVGAANDRGASIDLEQVGRHRTLEALAVDVASTRARRPVPADPPSPSRVLPATGAPTGDVIRAEGLSKTYPGGLTAVEALDLSVCEGEIFGLLGPNGAGKTTTVGMLTTLIIPTAGRAFVAGVDVVADPSLAKQYLGVVPQANNLDNNLTVLENLYFHGRYFGMGARRARATAEDMLERFRLTGRGRDRIIHLSGGMIRRLQVARALMQGPAVVFLDEPTAGLDPQSRLALWEILTELRTGGQTILVTTHYMEEADQFCDRVAIMDHGRILALDTPGHLKRSMGSGAAMLIKGDGDLERFVESLDLVEWVHEAVAGDGTARVTMQLVEGAMSTVMAMAERSGVKVADVSISEDSLETVFINLTGRELRE
jgi:ABC-2 type transport system ATP-binding protein